MKKWNFFFILFIIALISCTGSKSLVQHPNTNITQGDTIRIANDSLEYEVIIIDSGFNSWLTSRAFPRNYHTQAYLENKNLFYVNEWNNRVLQPQRYSPRLYEMTINYDPHINYGYEVNYLIYNYMIFFQNTYKQKLYGNAPLR
ncbi:DUF6146 family protein [Flavobacterium sp.]|uniref:DUF6146 family protein n=1 Tax=Flavobacterium sp. TaxID=239 RepID=UPI003C31EDAE